MAPWMALLEAWAVQALLRTPAFHRAVEKVAKNVHRVRHGLPREEEGGTKLEGQEESGFTKHFMGAVKGQLGAAEQAEAEKMRPRSYYEQLRKGKAEGGPAVEEEENIEAMDAEAAWRRASRRLEAKGKAQQVDVVEEDADAAWRSTSKNLGQSEASRGFMGKYMDALREQVRENKKDGR
ncbi:uncharacterized protein RCC_04527 [Ramularia collo-cygni]|uniref:Uncharacterized protein n=1 Tax=Ramularia collo-cygni TaxID=112498 RepID=A0A2D3VDM8_9PEZI|nr:uncharacterized protein RCC_04527 [Ramularia collo-cygni]CZT18683.1 uncharacterized protein RCC_04527 [Ramularia collo-cygni]